MVPEKMPECTIVRCENIKCKAFQKILSVLPAANDYVSCNRCVDTRTNQPYRQQAIAYEPGRNELSEFKKLIEAARAAEDDSRVAKLTKLMEVASKPLRGYNVAELHAIMRELERMAINAPRGTDISSTGAGERMESRGSVASCFVPVDVAAGDELKLKLADQRVLHVVVNEIEKPR